LKMNFDVNLSQSPILRQLQKLDLLSFLLKLDMFVFSKLLFLSVL